MHIAKLLQRVTKRDGEHWVFTCMTYGCKGWSWAMSGAPTDEGVCGAEWAHSRVREMDVTRASSGLICSSWHRTS